MPENADDEELKQEVDQESKVEKPRLTCPYYRVKSKTDYSKEKDLSHKLRFKDLITLKLNQDETTSEYICEVCRKKLGH